MKTAIALTALAGVASVANANIVISEVLGSTTGSDREYVEIYNDGGSAVDLTGWTIELWDSDDGQIGGSDGMNGTVISAGMLGSGQTWTLGNALAEAEYGMVFDQSIGANSVENSSYTMILADSFGNAVFSAFVTDGGAGDTANRAGTAITADITVGPDGTFLPAGYRLTSAALDWEFADFNLGSPNDPGVANYAVPAPGALALLGLGGLAAGRRRR